jgi:hypothetical protein
MSDFESLIITLTSGGVDCLDISGATGSAVKVHSSGRRIRILTTTAPANKAGEMWRDSNWMGVFLSRNQAKALMLAIAKTLRDTE